MTSKERACVKRWCPGGASRSMISPKATTFPWDVIDEPPEGSILWVIASGDRAAGQATLPICQGDTDSLTKQVGLLVTQEVRQPALASGVRSAPDRDGRP